MFNDFVGLGASTFIFWSTPVGLSAGNTISSNFPDAGVGAIVAATVCVCCFWLPALLCGVGLEGVTGVFARTGEGREAEEADMTMGSELF